MSLVPVNRRDLQRLITDYYRAARNHPVYGPLVRRGVREAGHYIQRNALRAGHHLVRGIKRAWSERNQNQYSYLNPDEDHYSSMSNAGTITNNHESEVVYQRRRAPRSVRRRARNYRHFVEKVLNAVDTGSEKQKVLFVDNFELTCNANVQGIASDKLMLYGATGNTAGQRDMYEMCKALGDTATSLTHTRFRSGYMEIAVINRLTTSCYIDCYYYTIHTDVTGSSNINALIANGFTNSPTNMGGTTLTPTTYGATPFQSKDFCQYAKIYKKTTTFLDGNGICSFYLKDGTNIDSDYGRIEDCTAMAGITRGIIMLLYGTPNQSAVNPGQPIAATVNVNVTRTYTLTNDRPGLVDSGTTLLAS